MSMPQEQATPPMPAEFIRPGEKDLRLYTVLPSLFSWVPSVNELPSATWESDQKSFKELVKERPKQVVFALIDGLGLHALRQRTAHAPFLRSLLNDGDAFSSALTCVPSTTSAAITSALTGEPVGSHPMLSYSLYDRDCEQVFNLINFQGFSTPVEQFQNRRTIFERLDQDGFSSTALGPARFIGQGLTLAALRGARYVSSRDLSDRVRDAIESVNSGVTLTYFYVSEIDHAGHLHGWSSQQWSEQLERVDRLLCDLASGLPKGTALIISADHGMVDSGPDKVIDVSKIEGISKLVHMNAGEGRVSHFYAQNGCEQELLHALREVLGQHQWVISREQMIALFHSWGASKVFRSELLGDVVVFSGGVEQVVHKAFYPPGAVGMIGVHGSLTKEEMEIPVLIYRA